MEFIGLERRNISYPHGVSAVYDAACPSCGTNNILKDDDLGVRLNCGSCGAGFIFGEEIVRERNRIASQERKRAKEEERKKRQAEQREFDERVARMRERRQAAEETKRRQDQEAKAIDAVPMNYAAAEVVSATPVQLARQDINPKKRIGRHGIICPNVNCGFVGKGVRKDTGSLLAGLLVLFICTILGLLMCPPVGLIIGFVIGLLLALLSSGKHILICPNCNTQIREI